MLSGYNELQGAFVVEQALMQCLVLWPRATRRMYRCVVLETIESYIHRISAENNMMTNVVSSVGSLKNRYLADDANILFATEIEASF